MCSVNFYFIVLKHSKASGFEIASREGLEAREEWRGEPEPSSVNGRERKGRPNFHVMMLCTLSSPPVSHHISKLDRDASSGLHRSPNAQLSSSLELTQAAIVSHSQAERNGP